MFGLNSGLSSSSLAAGLSGPDPHLIPYRGPEEIETFGDQDSSYLSFQCFPGCSGMFIFLQLQ